MLPRHIHECRAFGRRGKPVIRAVSPSDGAVARDFNKLKLDRLTCGYAYVQEQVRIIWCQHRTHRAIPRCIPVP